MLFPLIGLRKKSLAVLGLTLFCSAMLYGQANGPTVQERTGWSLYLKTEGAPWTKKFEVELTEAGTLVLTENDPQKMPKETISKLTVKLAPKDAQEIYEQALKAFREFRFADEKVERVDGTNLTLRLSRNDRALVMQFFHINRTEEENADVAKVLSLINKHLPEEHHIY